MHSVADQHRLFDRCARLVENASSPEEFSWRMDGIIHWWLHKMHSASDGRKMVVIAALVQALEDVGIESALAAVVPTDEATVN